MQRILEPYAIDPMVSVRIDEPRNLIILSGTQREIKHLLDIIEIFDVDFLSGYSVGLFPMQTDVKSLSADLDRLFGPAAQGTSPLAGIVRIIPIERMNGLLVVSTQARYLEEAKKWIDRLDKAGGLAGGMRLNVYQVQHGRADKLAQLLSDVYGNRTGTASGPSIAPGQRPAQIATAPGQPATPQPQAAFNPFQALASAFQGSGVGVSQNTRIIADIDNNSLLILSSPSDFETIQSALRQLDVPRRQVKVEVLVAEVALKDELKYGIEWFISTRNNTTGALRNPAGTLPTSRAAKVSDVASAVGLQLVNLSGAGNIRAVLQALGDDGKSTIISTPNVTVLDNEKASINVGKKISVSTGTSTTTGGSIVTSTSYLDTGVLLTVTRRCRRRAPNRKRWAGIQPLESSMASAR